MRSIQSSSVEVKWSIVARPLTVDNDKFQTTPSFLVLKVQTALAEIADLILRALSILRSERQQN